jgi:hypothetical protein
MRGLDYLVAGGIIALSAWAVAAQLGKDPVGEAVAAREVVRLEIGEALEDQEVVASSEAKLRLHTLLGTKATVFYSWSTTCPCVGYVNERLLPEIRRLGPLGVKFVAVAGDPKDTPQRTAAFTLSQWHELNPGGLPPYFMLLDPTQRLCRQLGFREAAHFAVFDANGTLRFRGTFDDNVKHPTQSYLPQALDAIVAGKPVANPNRIVPGYGCPFGAPAEECPLVSKD